MALDPVFANILEPFRYPAAAEAHMRKFNDSPEAIAFDIASTEADLDSYEFKIEQNRKLLPILERETIEAERDAALAKLKIIALKAKLAARTEKSQ